MMIQRWLCKLGWHRLAAMRSPIIGVAFIDYCRYCGYTKTRQIPQLPPRQP